MIFQEKLFMAFPSSAMPSVLTNPSADISADLNDAASFSGLKWPEVSRDHWQDHWGAYFSFSPEAFRYYLPSILNNFVPDDLHSFLPVDSLLDTLDTSGNPQYWDDFLLDRFLNLTRSQYELLYDWVQEFIAGSKLADEVTLERVSLTILALEEHSK